MSATGRNFTTGVFGIEVDGMPGGMISGVTLPSKKRSANDIPVGHELKTTRGAGNIEITPFEFSMALSSAKGPMLDKLKTIVGRASDNGGSKARWNGAVHLANYDGEIKETYTFRDAIVTEWKFVDFDVAGKEPVMMQIKLTPEDFEYGPGSGKVAGESPALQRKYMNSNFRVTCGGLDCTGITKFAGLNVKQTTALQLTGETMVPELLSAGLEYSKEISVDILAKSIKTWQDWKKNFVDLGNIMDEKDFTIELLDPSMKETLFTVTVAGCGIMDLAAPKLENNKAASALYSAKMYCDRIEFA